MVRLVSFLLRAFPLSIQSRIQLTNTILDVLSMKSDTISVDPQGNLMVNGRPIDFESARLLRESARAMQNSMARNVIRNAVTQSAVEMAFHNGDTPEKMFFGRAAIWYSQQEDTWIGLLAGDTVTPTD